MEKICIHRNTFKFKITFRSAYVVISDTNLDLLDFINKFQAQVGILGIQMIWTRDSEMALQNCKIDKKIMPDTNSKFLEILNLLIGQTVKNLSKIERTKFETLITVHMHQRDIFDMLVRLFKCKNIVNSLYGILTNSIVNIKCNVIYQIVRLNIKSTQDFEWLKQARFYFKQEEEITR